MPEQQSVTVSLRARRLLAAWRTSQSIWRATWDRLTRPAPSVQDPGDRRQAQLLAALLLIVLVFAITLLVSTIYIGQGEFYVAADEIGVMLALVVALTGSYALSRTRHYRLAARLFVASIPIGNFALIFPLKELTDAHLLIYLVVPVILSSALLSVRFTVILAAAQVAAMGLLQVSHEHMTFENNWIGFVTLTSVLIIYAHHHRTQVAQDRENALRASEERYRRLVELSPTTIAVLADDHIVYLNPAGVRLMGATSAEDITARPATHFLPPGQQLRYTRMRDLLREQRAMLGTREWQIMRLDGVLIDVAISAIPVDYQGRQAVQLIVYDVTAHKRAEAALKRSEAQNRALLDAIPDAIFRLDRAGRFIGYKPGGLELARSPDDVIGRTLNHVFPTIAPQMQASIEDARETGAVSRFDFRLTVAGEARAFEARVVASPDEAVIIVRDITERKQSEDALHRRDRILQALGDIGERLLQGDDLDTALPDVLAELGRVVGVNRVYLFEIDPDASGPVRARRRHAWSTARFAGGEEAFQRMLAAGQHARWMDDLRQGRAVLSLARDATEADREVMAARQVRSTALVPVLVGGTWWGFLGFDDCQRERSWLTAEMEALRSVAGTLGAALARQQSEAAEREQRALAEALRDLAAALSRTLDLGKILNELLDGIAGVVPHDAACILLVENGVARTVRSRGYERFGMAEPLRDLQLPLRDLPEPLRHSIQAGQPRVVADAQLTPGCPYAAHSDQLRGHLCAPIRVEDKLIGLLALDSATPGALSQAHAGQLQAFADQASVAIENARLFDATLRYAEELDVLYRATSFLFTSLATTTSLAETAQQIVEAVVRVFNVGCGLWLLDTRNGQLVQVAQAGHYQVTARPPLMIDGQGLIPTTVRTGQLIYAPDVADDPRYVADDTRTRSELVIPLLGAQGPLGALDLQSAERAAFTEQDRRILTAFAERATAAVENHRLYDELRRAMQELEGRVQARTTDLSVRNAVAQTLSSSLETDEMLNGVLETIVARLDLLGGAIYLLDEDSASLQMVANCGVTPEVVERVTGIVPGNSYVGELPATGGAPAQATAGISAVLSVPIWRQEQVRGVITLVHDQPRPWREDETRLIDAIGRQIGGALATAELYAEAVQGRARLHTILQSAADGVLVFDRAANPILVNPAAARLFSFFPAEQGGARRAAALLWDWLAAQGDTSAEQQTSAFDLPIEPLIAPDGEPFADHCMARACPLANQANPAWPCWLVPGVDAEDDILLGCPLLERVSRRAIQARSAQVRDTGQVLGTVIVLHDVTHFRELEELKSRFVSTVSHELRNPLSAVMLQMSTLVKYYDRLAEADRRRMLGDVLRQSHVLRELIEDILELSRFDARRALPRKEWFDLAASCRDLLQSMQPTITEKNLTVKAEQCAANLPMRGDPAQVMRAVRNLLSNAVKYTPEGGRITLRLARKDDWVRVVVADTGIGIPPEEQVYIFDRFFRAENAAHIASGTGLGLAITREIAELHGGHVELRSTPGEGSTFTLVLPVSDAITEG